MHNTFLLISVVAIALSFDFTNGFHDTANAVAPTIATRALPPRIAVGLASVLNLVGAFLSIKVAATIASALVTTNLVTLQVVFAGLLGAILWNVVTWYFAIPSSSSHALIGGVIGAMLVSAGGHAVLWKSLVAKVIIPAGLSPLVAATVAALALLLSRALTRGVDGETSKVGFRVGQIGSSGLLALAHGTNDAQKTMGVITLALVANGSLHETGSTVSVPHWVIWSCGLAIAAGTFIGGWRIIRTMGQGFTDLQPVQGFSAQIASSSVLFTAAHFGLPLSTTHAATGSIVGVGVAGERHKMRWNLVIDVAIAWIVTLPAAALVGALTYWLVDSLGSLAGVLVTGIVAAGICVVIMRKAREDAIDASNVNDEWGWHAEQIEQATTKETVAA